MTTMATMTRGQVIRALRRKLLEMGDDDHPMCRVSSEKGSYCHGLHRPADLHEMEHIMRSGWDGVSDADLIRFHRELLGEVVQITG